MNWLDWAIIIYVAWSGLRGAQEGLVMGLTRIVAMFLGIWGAFSYFRNLSVYLDEKLHASSKIMSSIELPQAPAGVPEALYQLPGEVLVRVLSTGLLNIIAFFTLLTLINIAVLLVGTILSRAATFSGIGALNRTGGVVLGFVRGTLVSLAVLILAFMVQVPLVQILGKGQWLAFALQGSFFANNFTSVVELLGMDLNSMLLRFCL